jgi:hypothetical protein
MLQRQNPHLLVGIFAYIKQALDVPEPVLLRRRLIAVEWVFDLPRHEVMRMFGEHAEAGLCAKINLFAAIDCAGITIRVYEFPTAGGLRRFGYVIRHFGLHMYVYLYSLLKDT